MGLGRRGWAEVNSDSSRRAWVRFRLHSGSGFPCVGREVRRRGTVVARDSGPDCRAVEPRGECVVGLGWDGSFRWGEGIEDWRTSEAGPQTMRDVGWSEGALGQGVSWWPRLAGKFFALRTARASGRKGGVRPGSEANSALTQESSASFSVCNIRLPRQSMRIPQNPSHSSNAPWSNSFSSKPHEKLDLKCSTSSNQGL
jgi:hypothetical protein